MTNLARLPAHLAVLQQRPDLTQDEAGLLNVTIKTVERLGRASLLIDKILIFSMLEEMLIRVRRVALRCEGSNVITLAGRRHDQRRRYEDAPEVVEQMRAYG